MKLGDVLKKARRERGLSTEEFARMMRMPRKEYEELEAGLEPKRDRAEIQRRLLEIGVDVDYH